MMKSNLLAMDFCRNLSMGIDRQAIAEGAFDAPLVFMSLHRTPLALALYHIARYLPRTLGTNDDQVGTIAWTKEATTNDTKETGRIVTHQLHHTGQCQHTSAMSSGWLQHKN